MLGIDAGYVILGLLGVAVLLFILVIVLFVKQSRLMKRYQSFMKGEKASSLEQLVTKRFAEVDELKEHAKKVDESIRKIDRTLLHTYQKMSVVKYDAFEEMGGNLSFVLVLLTAENDGWMINAMHSSREGCYIYAKEIRGGKCEVTLSGEETKALEQAKSKII